MNKETVIKYSREESLFYFEVSAFKNEGINKMMYSAIAELPSVSEEGISKEKIIEELEIQNQPQLNISVLPPELIQDKPKQQRAVNAATPVAPSDLNVRDHKKVDKKCCHS